MTNMCVGSVTCEGCYTHVVFETAQHFYSAWEPHYHPIFCPTCGNPFGILILTEKFDLVSIEEPIYGKTETKKMQAFKQLEITKSLTKRFFGESGDNTIFNTTKFIEHFKRFARKVKR